MNNRISLSLPWFFHGLSDLRNSVSITPTIRINFRVWKTKAQTKFPLSPKQIEIKIHKSKRCLLWITPINIFFLADFNPRLIVPYKVRCLWWYMVRMKSGTEHYCGLLCPQEMFILVTQGHSLDRSCSWDLFMEEGGAEMSCILCLGTVRKGQEIQRLGPRAGITRVLKMR